MSDPQVNEIEKMEEMKKHANFIEQRAKQEESKLNKLNKGLTAVSKSLAHPDVATMETVEQSIAVNDIYIESIKAKLQILNNL